MEKYKGLSARCIQIQVGTYPFHSHQGSNSGRRPRATFLDKILILHFYGPGRIAIKAAAYLRKITEDLKTIETKFLLQICPTKKPHLKEINIVQRNLQPRIPAGKQVYLGRHSYLLHTYSRILYLPINLPCKRKVTMEFYWLSNSAVFSAGHFYFLFYFTQDMSLAGGWLLLSSLGTPYMWQLMDVVNLVPMAQMMAELTIQSRYPYHHQSVSTLSKGRKLK